jgi:hypothetical protein
MKTKSKMKVQGKEVLVTWTEMLEWDNKRLESDLWMAYAQRARVQKEKYELELILKQKSKKRVA